MARLVPSTATRLGHQPRLRMRPTMAQSATPSSATVTATSASVSASMTVRRGLRPPLAERGQDRPGHRHYDRVHRAQELALLVGGGAPVEDEPDERREGEQEQRLERRRDPRPEPRSLAPPAAVDVRRDQRRRDQLPGDDVL